MKFHFNGCSITQGAGFTDGGNDTRIYPNLVSDDHINDANGGSSNLKIFLHSSKAILDNLADVYIVQWSALHRHWVYPAPDQGIMFAETKLGDSKTREGDPNPLFLSKMIAQYQLLNHDYGNIMQLIDFCRILQDQAKSHNVQLLFINGLVTWSDQVDYIKELVRDADSDHDRFVEQMQNNMELVDWDKWIDPFNNMYERRLDEAEDNLHPGPQTHKQIAKLIKDKLKYD